MGTCPADQTILNEVEEGTPLVTVGTEKPLAASAKIAGCLCKTDTLGNRLSFPAVVGDKDIVSSREADISWDASVAFLPVPDEVPFVHETQTEPHSYVRAQHIFEDCSRTTISIHVRFGPKSIGLR